MELPARMTLAARRKLGFRAMSLVGLVLLLARCQGAGPDDEYLTFGTGEGFGPGEVRFAVIGDYGSGEEQEGEVAALINGWDPDFITTVGDNNYPEGARETIDENIGRFYSDYIFPYRGAYGPGSDENRFFPIPGHVDWDSEGLQPYLDYFSLPGNERYYEFTRGPVHFFMLDTDEREPHGATADSRQARWLKQGLSRAEEPWKLVFAHHAPYTSHWVDDIYRMRWPFSRWGADAVLSGYYHAYERLEVDGIPYFITGTGGTGLSGFRVIHPESRKRYNDEFGAILVVADSVRISFAFVNVEGELIDVLHLGKDMS